MENYTIKTDIIKYYLLHKCAVLCICNEAPLVV